AEARRRRMPGGGGELRQGGRDGAERGEVADRGRAVAEAEEIARQALPGGEEPVHASERRALACEPPDGGEPWSRDDALEASRDRQVDDEEERRPRDRERPRARGERAS